MKKLLSLVIFAITLCIQAQHNYDNQNTIYSSNANVGIRNTAPNATLDVKRGDASWGTAVFRGTERFSHFNFSDAEHTYIRGGKASSNIFLNDNGGNVGIGTTNTRGYKLAVNGDIRTQDIVVEASPWPDYVFTSDYDLLSLEEVAEHIKNKGHLPNIPNAKEVTKNGIQLGEMNAKLLEKIEELTLYTIQQEKKIEKLKKRNEQLTLMSTKLIELQSRLEKLESDN